MKLIRIEIHSRDAREKVLSEVYDNDGNVIGDRPHEDCQREREELAGKFFFRAVMVVDDETAALEGPVFPPEGKIVALEQISRAVITCIQSKK